MFVIFLGLGGVAFVTLLERKFLGMSQTRLGPNKVTFFGLLQPVADGIKLLIKQLFIVNFSQIFFVYSPMLLMFLFILIWVWLIPWNGELFFGKLSSLVFFSLLGVGAYAVILTGWRRPRRFSKLGRLRGILQSLSFEVALILLFLGVLELILSFSLKIEDHVNIELLFSWVFIWIMISLIERNRAPFDLLEGERELIRGFNIEIGRLSFIYLFLREYGIIIVLRYITRVALFGKITIISLSCISLLLFLRSCFPRVRYDVIIRLIWQFILPWGIFFFVIVWFF